ncbi:hypothetical protein V1477_014584 [Vespula maculifrons]|uniref:Uncharacterized protein n=1 Tax=Vespula maculifrons TaxID=7453 RepID=A0ABD2BHU8_VESMC
MQPLNKIYLTKLLTDEEITIKESFLQVQNNHTCKTKISITISSGTTNICHALDTFSVKKPIYRISSSQHGSICHILIVFICKYIYNNECTPDTPPSIYGYMVGSLAVPTKFLYTELI